MRERFEVWHYSTTWDKWIRNIYPDADEAMKRFEVLQRKGKKSRPPQPVNCGLPLADRVGFLIQRLFKRTPGARKTRTRRDLHC